MFVRNGAMTPGPSCECDITFFVKGRPKSARQSRDSTVATRRVQSVTVPSSRVSRECRSPALRPPPFKNARFVCVCVCECVCVFFLVIPYRAEKTQKQNPGTIPWTFCVCVASSVFFVFFSLPICGWNPGPARTQNYLPWKSPFGIVRTKVSHRHLLIYSSPPKLCTKINLFTTTMCRGEHANKRAIWHCLERHSHWHLLTCSFCHLDSFKDFPRFGRKPRLKRLISAKDWPKFDWNSTKDRRLISAKRLFISHIRWWERTPKMVTWTQNGTIWHLFRALFPST